MINSSIALLKTKVKFRSSLNEKNKLITFINSYSYLYFRKNLNLFSNFHKIYIDGIILVRLLQIIGIRTKRSSFDMTSLAEKVFLEAIKQNQSVYIIGSTESAINKFIVAIKRKFPMLSILGFRNGYFINSNELNSAVKKIIELDPELVIVGMGTPNQEEFLVILKESGWNGVGYTCGGFIHQTANGIDYYPNFYNKYNLRWLYRILDEPKLLKRYMFYYPLSVYLLIFDTIKYKLVKNKF